MRSLRKAVLAAAVACIICTITISESHAVVYAVGENNTIIKRNEDGTWSPVPNVPGSNYSSIWGSSEYDIYVSHGDNTLIHYDGSAWTEVVVGDNYDRITYVTGTAPDDIYAFGFNIREFCASPYDYCGCVFKFDGDAWILQEDRFGNNTLQGWGSSDGCIFARGYYWDIAYKFDIETVYYKFEDGAQGVFNWDDSDARMYEVWGLDCEHVYVSGSAWHPEKPALYYVRYFNGDGDNMESICFDCPAQFNGVWGPSPYDLFLVGDYGVIYRYDGVNDDLNEMQSSTGVDLLDVWGTSPYDVYAVGENGKILHYDGASWSQESSNTTETLFCTWGTPGGVVATCLQGFDLDVGCDEVKLSWKLSSYDEGDEFIAVRTDVTTANQLELDEETIDRDGLEFSCSDNDVSPGETYVYRIDLVTDKGISTLFESEAVTIPEAVITLRQNYPNPFNPVTTIDYRIPEEGNVTLKVYDAAGREIAVLVDGIKSAGWHKAEWDGLDGNGVSVSSGVYFYRLKAGPHRVERKMVLTR